MSSNAETLEALAERIGSVSSAWQIAVARIAGAPRAGDLPAGLGAAVETIYEGYALHFGATRTLGPSTPGALRLLIGDWCYAAGLCDVANTGDLDAVSTLADLIADVAALADEPGVSNRSDDTPDPRELRWDRALAELA
jgi:hypothetical protein